MDRFSNVVQADNARAKTADKKRAWAGPTAGPGHRHFPTGNPMCRRLNGLHLERHGRPSRKTVGAPGVSRTHDRPLRRRMLYPTELRAQNREPLRLGTGPDAVGNGLSVRTSTIPTSPKGFTAAPLPWTWPTGVLIPLAPAPELEGWPNRGFGHAALHRSARIH